MILCSPLEQFSVLPLLNLNFFLDFSITNSAVYALLTAASFGLIVFMLKGGFVIPHNLQLVLEISCDFVISLAKEQLGSQASLKYAPILITTFFFVLMSNLLGLIPFSFAITAQLVVTFSLSFSFFIGVFLIGITKHKIHFLSFFLPSGAPLELAPLLVMIEIVSYIFRPISLGVRLFANITAGHSLLLIIAGFAWDALKNPIIAILAVFPLLIIVVIFCLELVVAFLQAYVFTVLCAVYIKDSIELH
jgi:ATP synthase subunit 6